MKFIKLTYLDNSEVWTNLDHIVAFELGDKSLYSNLYLEAFGTVQVKETPTQILAKFN